MDDIFNLEEKEPSQEDIQRKLEREQIARSYKKIFDSTDGKMVLLDIMRECHITLRTTFNANNSRVQDFMEGERNIGNYVIKMSQICSADIDELRRLFKDEPNEKATDQYQGY